MKLAHIVLLCALLAAATATAATYTVNGTSDLWLSGAAATTTAEGGDTLTNAAPLEITGITSGLTYTFTVGGSVSNTGTLSSLSPDGGSYTAHRNGAQNGISDITAPINSLIGVFLDSDIPVSGDASITLNFNTSGKAHLGTDFTTLAPALNQVFFIGDGLATIKDGKSTTTLAQTFIAPTDATRLFLGSMDAFEWNNNSGSFSVTLTAIPEPATYAAFLGLATLATVAIRRYRRRA